VNSPVLVRQTVSSGYPVSEREGVKLVKTESTVGGEEDDVTLRPQNADSIGVDDGNQPDDVREPEPHVELPRRWP